MISRYYSTNLPAKRPSKIHECHRIASNSSLFIPLLINKAIILFNHQEHVLYENPGVRRKVFYPNRQNPTLCPVQILEEEMAMRPSDTSCPSCLFLCIKYGGRTRNLPQNEYVLFQTSNNN